MPESAIATNVDEALEALERIGLPAIVRPAFTLGGRGGGIARSEEEYRTIVARGVAASPIGQVLIDQSVLGWGEFELEVMRDHNDNVVIVCSIENIDPMGVHTGDSVTVAPQQTLTDRLYQQLRDQAITVIRAVGVETGGSNVQFAVNPATEEILVIEMNPRVSRSSALASKATGFPIAKIAARLAVGYALEEITNDITGITPASLRADDRLRRRQVAALRLREVPGRGLGPLHAHEVGGRGDGHRAHVRPGVRQGAAPPRARLGAAAGRARRADAAGACSSGPASDRYDVLLEAFRRGAALEDVHVRTQIDLWFLRELQVAGARPGGAVRRRALVQVRRHLRRGVRGRHAVLLLRLGAQGRPRGRARRTAARAS